MADPVAKAALLARVAAMSKHADVSAKRPAVKDEESHRQRGAPGGKGSGKRKLEDATIPPPSTDGRALRRVRTDGMAMDGVKAARLRAVAEGRLGSSAAPAWAEQLTRIGSLKVAEVDGSPFIKVRCCHCKALVAVTITPVR